MITIGSLFTGYGGLDMAVEAVTVGRTIWRSDIDPGACKIIAHHWPDDPNLGDITEIDWAAIARPEILTGGFPCQDVSAAGRRAGLRPGTRSGLWQMMARAIDILRPSLVVAENVRGLLSADAHSDVEPCPWCVGDGDGEPALRALGAVLGDLADLGYDAAWHGLRAADIGAPHGRFRVFIVAWPQPGHADRVDSQGRRPAGLAGQARSAAGTRRKGNGSVAGRPEIADLGRDRPPAADADRDNVREQPEPESGRSGPPVAGQPVSWGRFEPAVRQWERLTRPAPAPTEPSRTGSQRLSPRFVEWMMGLPEGHVTDVPGLTRNEQLKALGNGVVPAQAVTALHSLLPLVGAA